LAFYYGFAYILAENTQVAEKYLPPFSSYKKEATDLPTLLAPFA
jgi:hypothetical protein